MSNLIDDFDEAMPTVHNVVATFDVKCQLDLVKIATRVRNCEYRPNRFSGAVCRILEPCKSTALIFHSGKVVITGAKNEQLAFTAARKFHKILKHLNFPCKNLSKNNFHIQNIQASTDVGFPVRLESLAIQKEHLNNISYEPELFPGLIYRLKDDITGEKKVTVLIFVTGKIVFTGAKDEQIIKQAFHRIFRILSEHRNREDES